MIVTTVDTRGATYTARTRRTSAVARPPQGLRLIPVSDSVSYELNQSQLLLTPPDDVNEPFPLLYNSIVAAVPDKLTSSADLRLRFSTAPRPFDDSTGLLHSGLNK